MTRTESGMSAAASHEWARARRALTLEPLLDAARKEAQIPKYRDLSFVPHLEKVLEIPSRLNLSLLGLQVLHANLVRFLVNRLRYEEDVAKYPEILDEDVSDPIIIIGLPRSGTTKLQRILSASPAVQPTYTWQMFNPAPFVGERRGDPSPRIEWAQAMASVVSASNPDFNRIHEYDPVAADECVYVPLGSFDYVMQWISTPDQTYLDWARQNDRTSPISYVKRMLQYLQWQSGGRRGRPWLTKNPGHTGEIAEVLQVFPNATFIMPERDIATTIASYIQMMWEILRNSITDLDRYEHARGSIEYWSYELNRFFEQRRALGNRVRVLDVPYQRVLADPIGIAREAYALHGLPLTKASEDAMRAWERNNPAHKFGKFAYDLADYGWSVAAVEKIFGDVAQRWRDA